MGSGRSFLAQLGVVAAVGGCAFRSAALTEADPDLWGHVRFGQLILDAGHIPRSDPFSYLSSGHAWINHEWLTEVLFALAHRLGGPTGLIVLKMLLVLAILATAYRHLTRRGLDVLRAGMVVLLLVLVMQVGFVTVRPHVFTYAFFFLVVLTIEAAEHGNTKWLWALPVVFALWVNFHGGFLAGLGVLGVWTATRVGTTLWRRYREPEAAAGPSVRSLATPIGALLASVLATLVNPYGVELLLFLWRTATVPRPEITEWQSVDITSVSGLAYAAFLSVVAPAVARSSRARAPAVMAVLAVTGFVPLLAVRHLPLFGIAGVVLAAEHLGSAFARRGAGEGGSRRLDLTVAAVGAAVGLGLALSAVPRIGCIAVDPEYYPVDAVRVLQRSGARGNLAIVFNWGEYAIWHLEGSFPVSMDGRRETVYPQPIYAEYLRFYFGAGDWDDLLEKHPTDVALVERLGPTFNLLSLKPGWSLVYSDSLAAIFARDGWPGTDRLRATAVAPAPGPGSPCFP